MNSLKTVTKYKTVSTGFLEWEIQNVSFHFDTCDCWEGNVVGHFECSPIQTMHIDSAVMQLPAGDGKQSKWHFTVIAREPKNFSIGLSFDGLFGSDGSPVQEPLHFRYSAVIEKSILNITKTIEKSSGKECQEKPVRIFWKEIPLIQLKSVWPHGALKISVEISHLANLVKEVFNNGQFLNLLDLKEALPLPMPSCYGNFMNNPELSDFKIISEGSSLHAHKFVLSVRSPVFRAMIQSGMSESTQNELKIQDMTIKTVKLMIEYIYKGTVETFPKDLKEKIELLDCAEKYELDGLKSICMKKIFSNLPTEKEVGELAMVAFTYGANDRASKVIKDFCIMNHAKLVQNPEYKKLFLANPQAFIN